MGFIRTKTNQGKQLLKIQVSSVIIKANNVHSNLSPPDNSTTNSTKPFPIGSYSLTTNLDSVSTACTANSETWVCYPLMTYDQSTTASLATFNWIITGTRSDLQISSSDNPFAITFANASLTLLDKDATNERYHFKIKMDKLVVPVTPITDDNRNSHCFFNSTEFEASLYTKKTGVNGTTLGNATQVTDSSLGWVNWPYAVEINQTIGGSQNTPNCYELENGVLGTRITTGLASQPTGSQCACNWRNYDF